ncbi:putative bifunctional diguanylate cyclase/phosphodiesterase [Zhongshania guokunii]|uniref:Bifunctional diguanylate cyclase/phosphodiesterase n=1 Tax=Zhongshania guokunii TaxID=641783 RepID=A0ABV3UA26_9GAMM
MHKKSSKTSSAKLASANAALATANSELAFQNKEKDKRAAELDIANSELAFQNKEKGKRAAELATANTELAFQNKEKDKRAAELAAANTELAFQNAEKGKRAAELAIANAELAFQNAEKGKRAAELAIANAELAFQNAEKGKRAAELATANTELAFQNEEKGKRAAELAVANSELAFQNEEKGKRAAELTIANAELAFQNEEKDKRAAEFNTLAFYDPLTGLPNRRLLVDRLQHALASSLRKGSQSAVIFINLDNFKDINDTLGYSHGDLLLEKTAQRLNSCLNDGDTLARVRDDEFVVILEDLDNEPIEAAAMAKAMSDTIFSALNKPYQLYLHKYRGTASMGAVFFGHDGKSADELLKQAGIAIHHAKEAGRNTLRFFNQDMQDIINVRASLEHELRIAVDKSHFELYYQVQVNAAKQALGAEALIRWPHRKHGLVSPGKFIPLAEVTGLIVPIGRWVVETACAQLGEWQKDALTRDLSLAVNVSALQFRQSDFVTQVQAAVQRHAIPPSLLKLELTESLLQEDIDITVATMTALKEVGVQFSLDDFGTGYSSLQYLKQLPLNQFKIDQSFVRDITTNSSDEAIVKTIISMAQTLHIEVIAEGVETEEQRQLLLACGCTVFQGYLFSKPVPMDEFEAMLRDDQNMDKTL